MWTNNHLLVRQSLVSFLLINISLYNLRKTREDSVKPTTIGDRGELGVIEQNHTWECTNWSKPTQNLILFSQSLYSSFNWICLCLFGKFPQNHLLLLGKVVLDHKTFAVTVQSTGEKKGGEGRKGRSVRSLVPVIGSSIWEEGAVICNFS